jgi:hypothetical protein
VFSASGAALFDAAPVRFAVEAEALADEEGADCEFAAAEFCCADEPGNNIPAASRHTATTEIFGIQLFSSEKTFPLTNQKLKRQMVGPPGFEPGTNGL